MKTHTVFACESQPIVIEGLARVLEASPEFRVVGSAPGPDAGRAAIGDAHPDVLLLDTSGGLKNALQFIQELRSALPGTQTVLWVTDLAEIDCFRSLQFGARGILKKTLPVDSLLECLRAVAGGNIWIENSISNHVVGFLNRRNSPRFTPREREIVRLVSRGMKNKEIAATLSITSGTVKVHLMHIFEKAGVKDRFELAVQGRKLLGVDLEEEEAGEARERDLVAVEGL